MTTFPEVNITYAMLQGGIERSDNTYRLSGSSTGNAILDIAIDWLGPPQDKPSEEQVIIWHDEWVVIEAQKTTDSQTIASRITDINENGASKVDFDDLFNTLELIRSYSSSVPPISAAFTTLRSRIGQKPAYLLMADNFVEGVFGVTLPGDPETASDADKRTWVHGTWLVVVTLALESSISLGNLGNQPGIV